MSRVTEVKTREDPIAKKGQKRALLVLPSFCSPFAIALLSDPFAIGWIFFAIHFRFSTLVISGKEA